MHINDDAVVILASSDQKQVELPVKAAKHSVLITNWLEIKGEDDEEQDLVLDLPNVESTSLEKIVEFLKHFEKNPFPPIPERFPEKTFEEVPFASTFHSISCLLLISSLTL
jgi:Skp1 family, tetramerisation domain